MAVFLFLWRGLPVLGSGSAGWGAAGRDGGPFFIDEVARVRSPVKHVPPEAAQRDTVPVLFALIPRPARRRHSRRATDTPHDGCLLMLLP
jgi:hypothetical protein